MSQKPALRVSDYMQKKTVTLPPTATLRDAVETMLKAHTNGLVIVNKAQEVVGILSSWDIIQYIVPDYLEEDKHLASFEAGDVFNDRVEELKNDPVSKFMSSEVHTCQAGHNLIEAATMLSEFRIRQLPVVDESGKLVGYINRTDIKRAIADVLDIKE